MKTISWIWTKRLVYGAFIAIAVGATMAFIVKAI